MSGTTLDFSTLIALANTPGPQQGMAQALLQQIADEHAIDERVNRAGARAMKGEGPGGLNFGDATEFHASYPEQLMNELVNKYGLEADAPSGAEPSQIRPARAAQDAFTSEMERFFPEPSLWDKTKRIASGIMEDPSALAEPVADIAAYGTPMIGNSKGVQDGMRDYAAMMQYAQNPRTDGFDVLREHGFPLAMDTLQSVLPLGWRSSGERAPGAIARLLNRYSSAAPRAADVWKGIGR